MYLRAAVSTFVFTLHYVVLHSYVMFATAVYWEMKAFNWMLTKVGNRLVEKNSG